MSLVWPKTVDIYLSQRLALVRSGDEPPLVASYSPTLPLATILERIAVMSFVERRKRRFRIALSCTLAPPISYQIPREVRRWEEKLELARAAAAEALSIPLIDIDCQIDPAGGGVAAALPSAWIEQLRVWATSHNAALASVRPLWAVAMQCRATRAAPICCLVLDEPDGTALVIRPGEGQPTIAQTLVGTKLAIQTAADGCIQETDLRAEQVMRLAFGPQASTPMSKAPALWSGHWHQS